MELTNEFRVGVEVPEAWKVLTDMERIAPMLPGAQLEEVEGDEYRGVVKVKVGPISAQYKGSARFVERDEAAGRVVLSASGREIRGQGNASATVTATLTPDGGGTKVSVVTDLTVTGKVAQFGRGILADVSAKLMGQFAEALEADLAAEAASGSGPGGVAGEERPEDGEPGEAAPEATGQRVQQQPDAEPLDLLALAGRSTLRRLAPVLVGVVVLVALVLSRRRARRVPRRASVPRYGSARSAP